MKISAKLCLAMAGAFVAADEIHAASLLVDSVRTIASQNNSNWGVGKENTPYHVSVNANNAGYAGLWPNDGAGNPAAPFQVAITETIQGWMFVGGGSNSINVSAESGGLITTTTTDTTFDSFQQASPQLWTTSDPGSDLLNPATTRDSSPGGYRGIADVSGGIDISGLASGTVYFFYGAYNSTPAIEASMKDTDGPELDINVANFHSGDRSDRKEMYVGVLTFVNDAGYDTIDYDYTAGNGRWGGIVVSGTEATAIPEPAAALIGLVGLAGLATRRRKG